MGVLGALMVPCDALDVEAIRVRSTMPGNYNLRWRARQKLKILERDKYQCVDCGARESLTLDHEYPVRLIKKDRNSGAWRGRWANKYLPTIRVRCVPCHKKIELARVASSVLGK